MTKQKVEATDNEQVLPHLEVLNRDLLFRSEILTDKIISEVKKRNDEEFGDVEVGDFWAKTNTPHDRPTKKVKSSAIFVDDSETWQHRKKMQFYKAVANKRSGVFNSLSKLVENGSIAESEKDFFELPPTITDYPFRQVNVISRIQKMDKSEWISITEQWVGISQTGSVVTCPVMNSMWYIRPKITYEPRTVEGALLPRGDNISADTVTKRAAIIRTTGYLGEIIGEKVYTHPFSEETFRSCLKMARGPIGNANEGVALSLIREGDPSGTSCKTIEEFLLPFNEIWEKQRRPPSNVNLKELADQLKPSREDKEKGLQYQ